MNAYIKVIDYYLPEKVITNVDISQKFPEWSEDKIFEKVGIRSRHVAEKNETALDMAEKAVKKLFASDKTLQESVDFILLCTQSPDYKLPTSACILQERLGLPVTVGALDFNLGCSGYEYGLSLAKGLIVSGMAKNVLLVTAETYSKYLHPEDKGNISIFGDAATATVVSTEGFARIGDFSFGTDGSGADELIIKTGGARNPQKSNEVTTDENGHIVSGDHLYMDGGSIFSFTLKQVPKMLRELLEKNALSFDDVGLFIFHQANAYMLEFLRKKLKIEKERFYYCIEDVGNTVSNTVPIALCHALKDGSLKNKSSVLLAGFGVGLSWSACLLNFSQPPVEITIKNYADLDTSEAFMVLKERNSETIRKQMLNQKIIPMETHLAWLKNLKTRDDCKYFLVLADGIPIGNINFTSITKDSCEIGDFIFEKYLSCGYGILFEKIILDFAFFDLNVSEVHCRVLESNKNVYKTHVKYFCFTPDERYSEKREEDGNTFVYNGLSLKKEEWMQNKNPLVQKCLNTFNVEKIMHIQNISSRYDRIHVGGGYRCRVIFSPFPLRKLSCPSLLGGVA